MKTFLCFILSFFLAYFAISQDIKIFQSEKLVKKWETPPTLLVPESVCFDPSSQSLFVSNINGLPTDKDGNGFISLLSTAGEITELRWVTGLNAPKGMGIFGEKLYVTDIDRVVVISIKSKTIEKFYEFPEAKFLNDIAMDIIGTVYVSDMMSTRIYRKA
jgi:hypothetical protein